LQNRTDSSVTEHFVHDAQWNPSGKEFVIIHGDMPHPKVCCNLPFEVCLLISRLPFMT
jgi:uncharacterized protein with WD repeat